MRNFTKTTYYAFILFLLATKVRGQFLRYSSSDSISDGINHVEGNQSSFLLLKGLDSEEECEKMYGFLPCSYTPLGHLFLILVYEYLLFHGESYVASGGERIFKILGPGIFGASAFHALDSLPKSLILLGHGITTNVEASYIARIVVLSIIPFIIIQILKIFHLFSSGKHIVIIFTLVISVVFLLVYFFYQIFQPWIQKRRLEYVKHEHLEIDILRHVQKHALKKLLTEDGTPNVSTIRRLFKEVDQDGDDKITFDKDIAVSEVLKEFDLDGDKTITMDEFVNGFTKWLDDAKRSMDKEYHSVKSLKDLYKKKWEETDMLVEDRRVDTSPWAWIKAIMLLVVGIALLGVLAEPLIHSVQYFSKSASIPSFFIAFILVPLATNARGSISAIKAASWKNPRTTSLTFSEIYGSVFMNNILGFSVLLSLIYFRGLSWDFSAEVLMILIVCVIMGFTASFSSKFPIWTSLVAYLLYPLSLILVDAFDDYFRWS
ncbi:hypothetical protein ACSBR2_011565 [Camellia fascicularis]